MEVEWIHDHGQTLGPPMGKLVGVIDSKENVDRVTKALDDAGFEHVEIIAGEEGLHLLERIHTFYFSDMEDRVLHWHIEEVKAGHFVLLIKTSADRLDEAFDIAKSHGAHQLIHFGWLTNTWMAK